MERYVLIKWPQNPSFWLIYLLDSFQSPLQIKGYSGLWVGIEWDVPERGKHSGTINNISYFETTYVEQWRILWNLCIKRLSTPQGFRFRVNDSTHQDTQDAVAGWGHRWTLHPESRVPYWRETDERNSGEYEGIHFWVCWRWENNEETQVSCFTCIKTNTFPYERKQWVTTDYNHWVFLLCFYSPQSPRRLDWDQCCWGQCQLGWLSKALLQSKYTEPNGDTNLELAHSCRHCPAAAQSGIS